MRHDSSLDELIGPYLAGELSPALAEQVRAYLDVDPRRRGLMAGLRDAMRGEHLSRMPDRAVARQELLARLESAPGATRVGTLPDAPRRSPSMSRQGPGSATPSQGRGRPFWRAPLAVASAYAAGAAATLVFVVLIVGRGPALGAEREYSTGNGERAMIRLSDGTSVMLGAASRLRYRPFARGDARAVYVDGEAYFSVTHSTSSPFVVYAGRSAVQVLGTAFTVRQYPGDTATQVVVTDGKVALRPRGAAAGTGMTLTRGDLGRLDAAGLGTIARGVNVDEYASWTRGTLTFRDTRLSDVTAEIERWYDVRIELSDASLASLTVTGKLTARSADEAIARLADVANLRAARNGRVVTLSPERR